MRLPGLRSEQCWQSGKSDLVDMMEQSAGEEGVTGLFCLSRIQAPNTAAE